MIVFILLFLLWTAPVNATDYILKWKDNSNNEDGFVILERYGPGNAEWNVLAVTYADVTTWKVKTPDDGTRVCWRIQSYNQAGAAPPSNSTCERN